MLSQIVLKSSTLIFKKKNTLVGAVKFDSDSCVADTHTHTHQAILIPISQMDIQSKRIQCASLNDSKINDMYF